jgi:hypothetical protein
MDNVKNETSREPYEPPVIEDVPVRAEEQLLAGCKQITTAGPAAFFCGAPTPCSTPSAS